MDAPNPRGEWGIYEHIARLSRSMHGVLGGGPLAPQDVLQDVTAAAVELLSPVQHAGVTLIRKQHSHKVVDLRSTAATSTEAEKFDTLQHQLGQGPCFEAIWADTTVHIIDMTREQRWPQLTAAVVDTTAIRSSLAIELYTDGQELGALNLHAETADAFDHDTQVLAVNLATHAAIALSGAQRGTQFRSALASRDLIGQAKGIIMERCNVNAVRAFDMLRRLSQDTNTPLADVATQLINADHPTPKNNPA